MMRAVCLWLLSAASASAAAAFGPTRQYFASCGGGLEPVLAAELASPNIAADSIETGRLGVSFVGDASVGARAVLWSRSALRVMELLGREEDVHTSEHLYEFARYATDWSDLIANSDQTVSVQSVLGTQRAAQGGRMRPGDWQCEKCGAIVFASKRECFRCGAPQPPAEESRGLTHSHFSSLTVKNAVVDALRDRHGWRPSVDTVDADVPLFLHLHKGAASLYRVLSGSASMHKRGYRAGDAIHAAALRETLAASMLLQAGYAPEEDVLCDPMCGSGTVVIEAALIAQNVAPGLLRAPPALARWSDVPRGVWQDAAAEAEAARRGRAPRPILANDLHGGALRLAERAAHAAGVGDSIDFSVSPAADWAPAERPNLVVTNPPWDVRLEGGEAAWSDLGRFLKSECAGARAWVLSGNKELTRHLRMRADSRLRVENAGGSLALIEYHVLPPKGSGQGGGQGGAPKSDGAAPDAAREVADAEEPPPSESHERAPIAEEATGVAPVAVDAPTPSIESAEALSVQTVPQLKEMLRERGLKLSGKKAELIERLLLATPPPPADGAGRTAAPKAASPSHAVAPPRVDRGGATDGGGVTIADGTGKEGAELDDLFAGLYK